MPLPIRSLRVFPNPWSVITLENGPQGALAFGGTRNVGPLRFVGAAPAVVVREARPEGDPRGNDAKYVFSFPSLAEDLISGTPIDLAANEPFWRDRLADGSLVAADEATANATGALYTSLEAARAAGIKEFEAQFGAGSFAEQFKGKPFVPAAKQAAPPAAASGADTGTGGGVSAAQEPAETTGKVRGGKS